MTDLQLIWLAREYLDTYMDDSLRGSLAPDWDVIMHFWCVASALESVYADRVMSYHQITRDNVARVFP